MPLALTPIYRDREIERLLCQAWGGGDGVIRNLGDDLEVSEQGTPDMTVLVGTGYAWAGTRLVGGMVTRTSTEIAPPVSNDRMDLVQILVSGAVSVKPGVEDPAPSPPAPDANAVPLATVLVTPATTAIVNADIVDAREYV